MKKHFVLVAGLMIMVLVSFSQSPQQMNYQAVVRDNSGNPVANHTPVSVRFTIHDSTDHGTAVFTETQNVQANPFGLISAKVGAVGNLSIVSWGAGDKFLQVETDVNNSGTFTDMGVSQLISVPYALYAANSAPGAQGPTGPQGIQGPTGVDGATGAQGATGANGVTGPSGADGAQGPTGATGPTGADGAQGPAGATGADGAPGVTGADGTQGPAGPTGPTGVGVASITDNGNGTATVLLTNGNSTTINLPVGPTGPTGAQGNQGTQGATGATGAPGADGSGVPAGAIFYFAAATVPSGYLECNGQAVSRTTYASLFSFISTIYGGGDGTTTFNVPDLRGEFLRGADDGRGVDAGRSVGSFQDGTGIGTQVHQTVEVYYDNPDGNLYGTFNVNSSQGYAGSTRTISYFKIRPRNVAMMPCIKY